MDAHAGGWLSTAQALLRSVTEEAAAQGCTVHHCCVTSGERRAAVPLHHRAGRAAGCAGGELRGCSQTCPFPGHFTGLWCVPRAGQLIATLAKLCMFGLDWAFAVDNIYRRVVCLGARGSV